MGKVEGRQKDRGQGPGSTRTASSSRQPPCLHSARILPFPGDLHPSLDPCLRLPDLAGFPLDSSFWSLVPPSLSPSLHPSFF